MDARQQQRQLLSTRHWGVEELEPSFERKVSVGEVGKEGRGGLHECTHKRSDEQVSSPVGDYWHHKG